MTDPAARMRAIREEITGQRAKMPPHNADGTHDGGISRFYRHVEAEPQELGYVDTAARTYGGPHGDQPHETVDFYNAAAQASTPAHTEPPRTQNPKPDPSQGGRSGGGNGDSPEMAAKQGRTRDALTMLNQRIPRYDGPSLR
ncbi:hypothetical protein DI005_25240 [Prauserella sp. PE36]|uniref:hypothetical protein n=1 Tax=Prauserella sp. PE36 TaxID=1504709 RepID=UPI000DE40808|nr:hypothetical protein [Prauserella sp. PE36]RBM16593.1 hypothetical protein DI005_25240 [Prauserella sp. PE36]